ncbi:MAG: ArdC family protein [Thermodesulfobacteriota bacterium]|nr:ArdC family protein [Thermodesulfobacteriota bacterium]
MNNRVKQVLDLIVEKFKSGEIPEAVAMASFPVPDTPSSKWSFTNRTLMFLAGTADARGFRQWKQVNRWVKKGARAIYILVPCFKKETDDETGEEKEVLRYFKSTPVFMYEDTEGKELDYRNIELPQLPLLDKAKEWGISVKAIPGNYRFSGYYSPERQEIALASPEEKTFFHELAHAGHERIKGKLTCGQEPLQEIVAELSAQALCRLVGRQANDTTGNSFRYIERYAEEVKLTPHVACLKVLGEAENVLNLILKGATVSSGNECEPVMN